MVAKGDGGSSDEPPRGLSSLDTALLRSVAEIAAKEEYPQDLRTLAKALIGVIQMQAEMGQLMSQMMAFMADEAKRRSAEQP